MFSTIFWPRRSAFSSEFGKESVVERLEMSHLKQRAASEADSDCYREGRSSL